MGTKKYNCIICGKELQNYKDNFIHYPSKKVSEEGCVLGYSGLVLCGNHANFLSTFLRWFKEWYKNGSNDNDVIYAELNKLWHKYNEKQKVDKLN